MVREGWRSETSSVFRPVSKYATLGAQWVFRPTPFNWPYFAQPEPTPQMPAHLSFHPPVCGSLTPPTRTPTTWLCRSTQVVSKLVQIREYISKATSMRDDLVEKNDVPANVERLSQLIDHLKEQEKSYLRFLQKMLVSPSLFSLV